MTKRTRILLVILGVVTLAAAAWIAMNLGQEVTYTDESIDVELVRPAGS